MRYEHILLNQGNPCILLKIKIYNFCYKCIWCPRKNSEMGSNFEDKYWRKHEKFSSNYSIMYSEYTYESSHTQFTCSTNNLLDLLRRYVTQHRLNQIVLVDERTTTIAGVKFQGPDVFHYGNTYFFFCRRHAPVAYLHDIAAAILSRVCVSWRSSRFQ